MPISDSMRSDNKQVPLKELLEKRSQVFITGTDTEVGKTEVSALICLEMMKMGERQPIYCKPVQCGGEKGQWDADRVSSLTKLNGRTLYYFSKPASPHFAAEKEGQTIDYLKLFSKCKQLLASSAKIVFEGAGGILVPFSQNKYVIDLAIDMKLPIILVAANKLGMLNHTLLSIYYLQSRGVEPLAIIINQKNPTNDIEISDNNIKTVKEWSGANVYILDYQATSFVG